MFYLPLNIVGTRPVLWIKPVLYYLSHRCEEFKLIPAQNEGSASNCLQVRSLSILGRLVYYPFRGVVLTYVLFAACEAMAHSLRLVYYH